MPQTLIHPPRTILEVWESLPEGTLCQIINDKLIMSPAPINIHQVVLLDIAFALKSFLNKRKTGEIRIASYDVYFSKQNILQPDIFFIKSENLYKVHKKGLLGAPDIVIEILSPSTSHIDLEEKKFVYERYGVQEYFIVEPNSKSVTAFLLKDGEYEEQGNTIGKLRSALLNTEVVF